MGVSGQLHGPAALLPGKVPLVTTEQEAGGPQSRSEHGTKPKCAT